MVVLPSNVERLQNQPDMHRTQQWSKLAATVVVVVVGVIVVALFRTTAAASFITT
jgi:hypothetical protein